MRIPELLRSGDTVAILATSGPCDSGRLAAGVEAVKHMGLRPRVMESCRVRHGYLAGPDNFRIRDLHTAFADPRVRGIFVARGGYGAARLLGRLDYDLIRANPKVFVGYSDVTALHVVFNQICEFATFHGPMPVSDFYGGCEPFTLEAFKNMVFATPDRLGTADGGFCANGTKSMINSPARAENRERSNVFSATGRTDFELFRSGDNYVSPSAKFLQNPSSCPLQTIFPGQAWGPLVGGNLCILAASMGTPYELDTRGRILFLEETGEDPYRVDRMLLQLKQAKKFSQAAGIILGDFSPQTLETLHISINELIAAEKKPTLAGLACGHTSPSLTLPLGQNIMLDATAKTIAL
ncbi:MAG: LD-carboxypeptidase [Defluviitaleaceae bacterium]|nr:LD-carboxypeptidase [Defluviitaleaceae bacterium]